MNPAPTVAESPESQDQKRSRILLLMPCGASKLAIPSRADEIYTGPIWQSLRTHGQALLQEDHVDLWVLSAKHGVLRREDWVEPYDQMMTPARVEELVPAVSKRVDQILAPGHRYGVVVFVGGHLYRGLMEKVAQHLQSKRVLVSGSLVVEVHGQIGEQRARLAQVLAVLEARPSWSSVQEIDEARSKICLEAREEALYAIERYMPWKYGSSIGTTGVQQWVRAKPRAREMAAAQTQRRLRERRGELAELDGHLAAAKAWQARMFALQMAPTSVYVMSVGRGMPMTSPSKRSALQAFVGNLITQIEALSQEDVRRAAALMSIKTTAPCVALERRAYFDPQGVERALAQVSKRSAMRGP
ncbi:MAG: hypothetical protein O9327_05905 [Polaromonas sp.]|nr:hypothetical protein [Polaromonas sp.]